MSPDINHYSAGERDAHMEQINDNSNDCTTQVSKSAPSWEGQPETANNAQQIISISRDLLILEAVAELTLKTFKTHTKETMENKSDMTKQILALEQKL